MVSFVRSDLVGRGYNVERIYTTDTDFLQFSGIEVTDPLQKPG